MSDFGSEFAVVLSFTDLVTQVGALTAAASAGSSGGFIYLPSTIEVTSSLVVPANVTLWFASGAHLQLESGVRVEIHGRIVVAC